MAYVLSEKARAVLVHLQAAGDVDETSKDVAKAVGIEPRSITGVLNGMVKKGLVVREVVGEQKFIRLTDNGTDFDPDTEKVEE